MIASQTQQNFSQPLLDWFDKHGRKDLPWQYPRIPYRVWVSEIMLQQTQVKTVIPYFNRFINRFPDVHTLASASEDDVLAHWSGLGYYSRARNLHKAATIISTEFHGTFPKDVQQLIKLPGIGPSTAAAITSLAFDMPTAILDGNVKRVLSRYFLIGGVPLRAAVHQQLWELAQECMPVKRCADYTQAIMDLGATCCTAKNPTCLSCPLQATCIAKKMNVVSNYPNKNPKKILPIKQQQFLLLHTLERSVYLEKRHPTGLWGGLWCLPSIDLDHCPKTYVSKIYRLQAGSVQELMSMKHTFSHFHLRIHVVSMQTTLEANSPTQYPGSWFSPQDLENVGLAKPVSDIIHYFFKTYDQAKFL